MALAGVICLLEFAGLLFKSMLIISYCCLKTQLSTWESGGEFTWRLSYCVCGMRGTDRCLPLCHHPRSWNLFSCWLISGKSVTVFLEQIFFFFFRADFTGLQGLQNNFTCYFSQFLPQPCEAVDKYFHPCSMEGETAFQEGECWAPGHSFLFSQWSWFCNQGFLSSCFDPIILLHPPKSGFKDIAFRIKSGKL